MSSCLQCDGCGRDLPKDGYYDNKRYECWNDETYHRFDKECASEHDQCPAKLKGDQLVVCGRDMDEEEREPVFHPADKT